MKMTSAHEVCGSTHQNNDQFFSPNLYFFLSCKHGQLGVRHHIVTIVLVVFPYLHDVISLNMTLNMILSHSML